VPRGSTRVGQVSKHCHVSQPYWSMSVWISDRWTPHMPRGTHSLVHINSHPTQPYATWQHHTQPHQTDSATWHCLIGPCQQVGPTTAETATKWVPPECHVAVCYLATSSPHATWHHHINAHQCVISSVIAMCQALIRPLSLKPMTPQHNMTHGTALLVPCQLITRLIEANPER
jgi:hypothetical protein